MRSDRWQFLPESRIILFAYVLKVVFPVQGINNTAIFIENQKAFLPANFRFFVRRIPVFNYLSKTLFNVWCHRNDPITALCFWFLDIVSGSGSFVQLMINTDAVFLEVDIRDSKTAEF